MVQRKSPNHVNEVEVLGGVPRHLLKDFLLWETEFVYIRLGIDQGLSDLKVTE